jgi:hypothetical protein
MAPSVLEANGGCKAGKGHLTVSLHVLRGGRSNGGAGPDNTGARWGTLAGLGRLSASAALLGPRLPV